MPRKKPHPCLRLRSKTYYFRISVPSDLRYILSRASYKKSLGCGEYKLAVRLSDCYRGFVERYFEELRIMRPSEDQLLELVKNHFEKCLMVAEDDIYLNYQDLRDGVEGDFDYERKVTILQTRHNKLLKISQTQQFLPEHGIEAQELLDWKGYILAPFSAAYKNFLEALVDAKVEAARLTIAKFQKDLVAIEIRPAHLKSCRNYLQDPDPVLLEGSFSRPYHVGNSAPGTKAPEVDLQTAINRYIAYRNEPDEWKERHASYLSRLADILGGDRNLSEFTKDDARYVEKQLWFIPANYKKKYSDILLADFFDGQRDDYKRLSEMSVKIYFFSIKSFFDWCLDNDYVSQDLFKGVKLNTRESRNDEKIDRRPFAVEELEVIFNSALFSGRKFLKRRLHVRGDLIIRDGNFWVPLIGLFAGLRLSEILYLTIADVKWDRGVAYFDINDLDGKKLKNKQSARKIPIHPVLKDLGFLEYFETRKATEQNVKARLFDGITYPKKGKIIKNFSRFFGEYLSNIKVKQSPDTVFHSLRHNYVDALRRACSNNPEVMAPLDGRTDTERSRGTRAVYGSGFETWELYPYIEKMDLKVDLSHLYR